MRGILGKIKATLAAPPEPFLITRRSRDRVRAVIAATGDGAVILNVGAGFSRLGERVINVEIFDSGTTHVKASALALPFADGSADLVILQGVLEHVRDAHLVIAECTRVLKPGALFFTEMPFLQPYHECPIDVCRSTRFGLSLLCRPLIEVESGIHIGPASTLTWFLREFLAQLISCGRQGIYRRASSLVGWVVFPIKYLDLILEKQAHFFTIASSCYYLGRKRAAVET